MTTSSQSCKGFTLIELLVTLSLITILMTIAAPSFTSFLRNAELTSRTNSFLANINAARSEAMKRGRDAVVIPLDGASWNSGSVVFVDMNNNRTYEVATDVLVYRSGDVLPNYLEITANGPASASPPYMRFDAQGYPKPASPDTRNFTFSIARNDVSGNEVFNQTRRLKVAITGRARICKPASASDSACSSSNTYD